MKKYVRSLFALTLALCLCLPLFSAFASEQTHLTFDAESYLGTERALPYFYTKDAAAATLTDCLEGIAGDAILPDQLGDLPLRAISSGAFADCDALTSVFVPKGVTSIGENAFPSHEGFTLHGAPGSYAETYAAENGYAFSTPFVLGDADQNGTAGASDLSTMAKFLSGWTVKCDKKASDIDENFEFGAQDITILAKDLSGWSGKTLYVLGDETVSVTEGDSYYPAAGYGDYLEDRLSAQRVTLLAAEGASAKNTVSTQNYLSLFNRLERGDTVLISFGIHDADSLAASYAPAAGTHKTAGSFAYYLYEYYVLPILARGATPVLATPVTERPADGITFTEQVLHSTYADSVRALAEAEGIALLDLTARSKALYEERSAEENAYLNAWETKEADSVNNRLLSVFGAEQIAKLAARELSEIGEFSESDKPLTLPEESHYLSAFRATAQETIFTYSDGSTSATTDTTITSASYSVPEGESLVSVSLAEGVRAIGEYAFFAQYDLTTVGNPLPNSLVSIGDFAFHSCNALWIDLFPENLAVIGNSAFYGCESLVIAEIPKSVTELGEWAFYGCDSITGIAFSASLYTVPKSAFGNCLNLQTVDLHEFVEGFEERAFDGCAKITELTLPEGFVSLERYALRKTSLSALTLPESIEALDARALAGCTSLATLAYPLLATDWISVTKGEKWYEDTLLSVINCHDGDVTVEGVVLVDYHAYYSDFATALTDANAHVTEHADLTRHEKEDAAAAILIEEGVLTLKLLKGADVFEILKLSGNFTLDLMGQTVVFCQSDTHFELAQDADITVSDSVGGGRVYKRIDSSAAQYLYNMPNTGTAFTITGGTHTCENQLGSSIAVRANGQEDSSFTMTGGTISATAGESGNAKALQAPISTVITGGALASKSVDGNSYAVSGIGNYEIRGGSFDSYTFRGNSIAFFIGSGTLYAHADIYDGIFITHASGRTGKHIGFSTALGASATIYGGTFTVDSKKTGDAGACGIATAGPSLVIYNAYVQGNSAGLQALGKNTTIYGGTYIGADHGGAYFGHNTDIGTIAIFGGTFRFEQPDWQSSTSGTGSAYITGGGKIYIDSATFEGRMVAISSIAGDSPDTEVFISRTTAPEWRVDTVHTVHFGKGMSGAITNGNGTIDRTVYADVIFDEAYLKNLP